MTMETSKVKTKKNKEKKEPIVRQYKCIYCKEMILGDLVEIPVESKHEEKKKAVKRAHRDCWREHKKLVQDRETLFNCVKDTFFIVNFPSYMAVSLNNLHAHGSKYTVREPNSVGYPYIVIYNALMQDIHNLKNYLEYAEKQGKISDSQHKSNIILKSIEKHLEQAYSSWKEAKRRKEGDIKLDAVSNDNPKANIVMPSSGKLIDFEV